MRGSAPGERRGGRQPGTPNKRTQTLALAQAEASERVTQALGPAAFDGDALSFLQLIYRDATQAVETRLHAAKAAVAYEKPRLQTIAMDVKQPRDSAPFVIIRQIVDANETTGLKPPHMTAQEAADAYAATLKDFEDTARRVASEI
jgi:hypothetical protein